MKLVHCDPKPHITIIIAVSINMEMIQIRTVVPLTGINNNKVQLQNLLLLRQLRFPGQPLSSSSLSSNPRSTGIAAGFRVQRVGI